MANKFETEQQALFALCDGLDQDFYKLLENTTARLGAVESDLAESNAVCVRLESALLSIANFITGNRDAMDHKTQNWMAHIQMRINHELFYGSDRAKHARANLMKEAAQ